MSIINWLKGKTCNKVNHYRQEEMFGGLLVNHLQRTRKELPNFASFLDQYFEPDQIDILASIAEENMSLTKSDGQEHSYAITKVPVYYQIYTLPVGMDAKDWFVRNYGGYLNLLERSWNAQHFKLSGCTMFCHIVCGITRQGRYFIQMAIVPTSESSPIPDMVFPVELLTPQERQVTGI